VAGWSLLEVERFSFHFNVDTEIFITVHSGGELSVSSGLLFEVERFSLHLDINTKVLVTIHS
jgi:hypothetical protein